jgi:large subunit ribosomal protein L9
MATQDILLLQPIEGLGNEGEQIRVKSGYARNFLLPRKLAIPLTDSNRKQIESLQRARDGRLSRELSSAEQLAARLETVSIAIPVKTGPGGKVFGSVTAMDLQKRLGEEGIELNRKQFTLYNPVKTLGRHSTKIRLHPEITAEYEFEVVSENPIEEDA